MIKYEEFYVFPLNNFNVLIILSFEQNKHSEGVIDDSTFKQVHENSKTRPHFSDFNSDLTVNVC